MRIGILTGGGDAPGLNAAIRGVSRRAFQLEHRVSGIKNGWAGALEGDISELTSEDVRGILPLGGTILGTSRTNPLKERDGIRHVVSVLRHHGVDGLVAIGGDDTLSVAAAVHEAGCRVVGVPKTIDNDLAVTEFCIGFDTAVGVVVDALDRLHTTASAHHRVMVVEVMGRDTGWVALVGGLAGGADLVIIPEYRVSLEEVVEHLYQRRREGKDFSIIVVAEGARMPELGLRVPSTALAQPGDPAGAPPSGVAEAEPKKDAFGHIQLSKLGVGDALSGRIEEATGFETRVTVLGHLQRGGSPSPVDRIWATRLGVAAADLLAEQKGGLIPIRKDGAVVVVPIREVIKEQRSVPRDLYELTRVFD